MVHEQGKRRPRTAALVRHDITHCCVAERSNLFACASFSSKKRGDVSKVSMHPV